MVGDEEQDEILRVIIYWEWEVKWKALSCVWFFVTTWTKTAHGILHARILEWVAFPLSFPNTGIKLRSPSMQADSLPAEPPEKPTENDHWLLSSESHLLPGLTLNKCWENMSKKIFSSSSYSPHLPSSKPNRCLLKFCKEEPPSPLAWQ